MQHVRIPGLLVPFGVVSKTLGAEEISLSLSLSLISQLLPDRQTASRKGSTMKIVVSTDSEFTAAFCYNRAFLGTEAVRLGDCSRGSEIEGFRFHFRGVRMRLGWSSSNLLCGGNALLDLNQRAGHNSTYTESSSWFQGENFEGACEIRVSGRVQQWRVQSSPIHSFRS